jgi:outer membrane lipoprotein-sorting protein
MKNRLPAFKVCLVTSLFLISLTASAQRNNTTAEAILDKVYTAMSSYPQITLSFDYYLSNKEAQINQNTSGKVYIQEPKYRLELFESVQLFDGLNTYSIIPENLEVVISNPNSLRESGDINPSKLFSFYKEGYRIDKGFQIGENVIEILLFPIDSNAEIEKVLVRIDTKSNRLVSLTQVGFNKTETTIKVTQYDTNTSIDKKLFMFDRKAYESSGYYIID